MNNFLEILKENKIRQLIIGDKIHINISKEYDVIEIDDVRSAAFYAFGQSKISNSNSILIINGEYLPNIYTVLTEAWFQKANLTVIALFNSIYDVETNYLNNCTVSNTKISEKDINTFKEKINDTLKKTGPKVINIILEQKVEEETNNYNNVIEELKKIINNNDEIICYNSSDQYNCQNIPSKYKYGVISKYCASIMNIQNNAILICTDSCIKVDSNIFNNRYLNNKLKIIVKTSDEKFNIKTWIEANNILYIEDNKIANNIKKLYNAKEPTIFVIKGDE